MEEAIRNMLKEGIGITDEDLDKLAPNIQKLLSSAPQMMSYKFVFEVVDAYYCFAGAKVGDKVVFGPGAVSLNMEETTWAPCIGFFGSMMEHVHIMWDRIADGRDPNDTIFPYVECFDRGLAHGGLGKVWLKLRAEKVG